MSEEVLETKTNTNHSDDTDPHLLQKHDTLKIISISVSQGSVSAAVSI